MAEIQSQTRTKSADGTVTYSVTTTHGTFSGKTLKAAVKQADAVAATERQREVERRANYEEAEKNAELRGYKILHRFNGKMGAHIWLFVRPTDADFHVHGTPPVTGDAYYTLRVDGGLYPVAARDSFLGVLVDFGGHVMAYGTLDTDGEFVLYAVGQHNGLHASARCPGITVAWLDAGRTSVVPESVDYEEENLVIELEEKVESDSIVTDGLAG